MKHELLRVKGVVPVLLGIVFCARLTAAEVAVSGLFGSGAVIQQGAVVPVWGTAPAGQQVTVRINGKEASAIADGNGGWKAELPALPPGGPFDLEVCCGGAVARSSVMIGDVWLMTGSPDHLRVPGGLQPVVADSRAPLRFLSLPYRVSTAAVTAVTGKWQTCGEGGVVDGKSLPAQFARRLRERNSAVPVGVILAVSQVVSRPEMGVFDGDIVEAWAPPEALAALSWNVELQKCFSGGAALRNRKILFDELIEKWKLRNGGAQVPKEEKEYDVWYYEKQAQADQAGNVPPPVAPSIGNLQGPSSVWNGMLAQLAPCAMRGVVFAPGIGNLGNPAAVGPVMEKMVPAWRARWGRADLPVICLGVPPNAHAGDAYLAWSELADGFRPVASMSHAALIPFHDLYDFGSRAAKLDPVRLAERLVPVAEGLAGGTPVAVAPVITAAMFSPGEAILKVADEALLPPEGSVVDGFTLYSPRTHWVWARGVVRKGTIAVAHAKVPAPTAVRYGWLWDKEHRPGLAGPTGIPSPTFRSDACWFCPGLIPTVNLEWARRASCPPGASLVAAIDVMPVTDPALPWVMTIGDSIHSGYRDEVRRQLAGVANVVPLTIPHNVKMALAGKRPLWGIVSNELAVLHINHGLHGDFEVPPAEFEPLLDSYFSELRSTVGKGRIIWAATTPIPSKKPGESLDPGKNPGVISNNAIARRLADKHGMKFNDLYVLVADRVDELSAGKGNVHYKGEGCSILAKAVADSIRRVLEEGGK